MSGYEEVPFEIEPGHTERLSQKTLTRITGLAEEIIQRHGEERDAGLEETAEENRSRLIKAYEIWGITEETPVVKQLTAKLKNARALPVYLKTGQSPQAIVIIKPLIPQIGYKYKISYGELRDLKDRWFLEGVQIDIWDEDPSRVGVFERDPSTRDYTIKPITEGRGKEVILDLEEVLAGYPGNRI